MTGVVSRLASQASPREVEKKNPFAKILRPQRLSRSHLSAASCGTRERHPRRRPGRRHTNVLSRTQTLTLYGQRGAGSSPVGPFLARLPGTASRFLRRKRGKKTTSPFFVLKAPEMGARARHLRRSRVLSRGSHPSTRCFTLTCLQPRWLPLILDAMQADSTVGSQ